MRAKFWRAAVPFIAATIALLTPIHAAAKVFCAANTVEILGVLDLAAHEERDADIRIAAGSYSFSTSIAFNAESYRISGGWDLSCTHQTPNGLITVLQSHSGVPIGAFFESKGQSQMDTLTFREFKEGVVVHLIPYDVNVASGFTLRTCAFIHDGSVRMEQLDGPNCAHGSSTLFRDNLVAQSVAPVLATEITTCAEDTVQIVHNTFASNPGRALGVFGPKEPNVFNNAFSNNVRNFAWDFFPTLGHPQFCGNVGEDFTAAEASHNLPLDWPGACAPQGNLPADPQLDPATFKPLPGSPAIDFGWTPEELGERSRPVVFPDHDLQGNLRFSGLRPDAGVFESAGRCRL